MEIVFRKKNLPFYSFKDLTNLTYLLEDLKPSIIVLDAATALAQEEELRRVYADTKKFNGVPVALMNHKEGLEFIENPIGEIPKPLEPFGLPDLLQKFLSQN